MDTIQNITIKPLTLSDEIKYVGNTILKYKIVYPYLTSDRFSSGLWKINKFYADKAHTFQRYVNKTLKTDAITNLAINRLSNYPVNAYEALMEFTPTLLNDNMFSLYTDQYIYAGGAHGSTARSSETWNLKSGERIPLTDFHPDLSIVKKDIISQINEQMKSGDNYFFTNYTELVKQNFHPENYYLTPDGMIVFFQEYDIAPYAAGIVTFEITQ